MVASSQSLATLAGIDLLRAGGSAVDAAIATNAVLAVTEPQMCGPGGDLFAMVWDPARQRLDGLNASGRAPLSLGRAALCSALDGARVMPARGPLTLTTPGAIAGWQALHQRHGKLPWARLFEPAIEAAGQGFAVGLRSHESWSHGAGDLLREPRVAACVDDFRQVFWPEGRAPGPGDEQRNPGLAQFFRELADQGSDAFYHGPIGEALLQNVAACGGHLTRADLERAKATWVEPLSTRYRGHDVHVLPPNGQGLSVLQMLAMLETFPPTRDGDDPAWWHRYLEAKKLAFADRARHYADPDFAEFPLEELLSPLYVRARAALMDPARAQSDPAPGHVAVPASDTTYLTVADADGMMVSLIQSLFVPFGSGVVVAPYGFALQSRGSGFSLERGHPNEYAPGKRPFHTIMPGFVTREGQPFLSFGAIGGDMQPQAQVQILARILEFGLDVQRAGELPRLRHHGGAAPNGDHQSGLGVVEHEPGFPSAILDALTAKGHAVRAQAHPVTGFAGGYQGIMRHPVNGGYEGGSDPRLDGCALGL
jgi:gamma-glutamyltranspeptidase/glutathione hydrolase